jgi:hypothetical protein
MAHASDLAGEVKDREHDLQEVAASLQTTERFEGFRAACDDAQKHHASESDSDADAHVDGQSSGRKEDAKAFAALGREFALSLFPAPSAFLCPITYEIMRDPVFLTDTGFNTSRVLKLIFHSSFC